jgi:hypothetical protein
MLVVKQRDFHGTGSIKANRAHPVGVAVFHQETQFSSRVHTNLLYENTLQNGTRNSLKNICSTSRHVIFTHNFSGKRAFLCVSCKKDKFQCSDMTIDGSFFVLFT